MKILFFALIFFSFLLNSCFSKKNIVETRKIYWVFENEGSETLDTFFIYSELFLDSLKGEEFLNDPSAFNTKFLKSRYQYIFIPNKVLVSESSSQESINNLYKILKYVEVRNDTSEINAIMESDSSEKLPFELSGKCPKSDVDSIQITFWDVGKILHKKRKRFIKSERYYNIGAIYYDYLGNEIMKVTFLDTITDKTHLLPDHIPRTLAK